MTNEFLAHVLGQRLSKNPSEVMNALRATGLNLSIADLVSSLSDEDLMELAPNSDIMGRIENMGGDGTPGEEQLEEAAAADGTGHKKGTVRLYFVIFCVLRALNCFFVIPTRIEMEWVLMKKFG